MWFEFNFKIVEPFIHIQCTFYFPIIDAKIYTNFDQFIMCFWLTYSNEFSVYGVKNGCVEHMFDYRKFYMGLKLTNVFGITIVSLTLFLQ